MKKIKQYKKERECLKCGDAFESHAPDNRICKSCRAVNRKFGKYPRGVKIVSNEGSTPAYMEDVSEDTGMLERKQRKKRWIDKAIT